MRSVTNPAKYTVLLGVMDWGSLTSAAEKLGYTQSGISHIIADLEAECGFPLIKRTRTGSGLTREGERLTEPIRALQRAGEQLFSAMDEINGLRSGVVRVGMFSSVAVHWAPELLKRFSEKYPNISVEVFSGLYNEIEDRVLSEELDCGFLSECSRLRPGFRGLARDRLLAVLPAGHELCALERVPLEAIANADLIIPGEGTGYDIGELFRAARIKPRVKYALSDDYAALSMAERGLGITILPELILAGQTAKVELRELDPACCRTIGIATRPGRLLSPAAAAFVEMAARMYKTTAD